MITTFDRCKESIDSQLVTFENLALTAVKQRGIPDASIVIDSSGSSAGMGLSAMAGSDSRTSLFYERFRGWVYVAIRAIAQRAAAQAVNVGQITGASANPQRSAGPNIIKSSSRRCPKFVKSHQQLEVFETHELLDVLDQPNAVQHRWEFLFTSIANLYLTGTAYWIAGQDDDDRLELWAVPTNWVTPIHKDGLFSGYILKTSGMGEGTPLPPEAVARFYFPDPANPRQSISPVSTQILAVDTDESIQTSQKSMFDNGIFPQLILTTGGLPGSDGKVDLNRRHVLTGAQRSQITAMVRKLYGGVRRSGEPVILDGLIQSAMKMSNAPAEMDFLQSGELVKKRIFQAFGVNPIVVGEIAGVNRAQAAVAEEQFCSSVVNPVLEHMSQVATSFLGPMFDDNRRLVVWFEPCRAKDDEMQLKEWTVARQNGDVSANEFRTEVLGIPTDDRFEDTVERSPLLETVGGISGAVQLLQAMGQGGISEESAISAFQLFYGLSLAEAESLAGGGAVRMSPPQQQLPAPEGDETDEVPDDEIELDGESTRAVHKICRADIKQLHLIQKVRAEKSVVDALQKFFAEQIKSVAAVLGDLSDERHATGGVKAAEQQAVILTDMIFQAEQWDKNLLDVMRPIISEAMRDGVLAELMAFSAVKGEKRQPESPVFPREIPTDLPDWMHDAIAEEFDLIFAEDYWQKINMTTRDDVRRVLERAISEELSIPAIRKELVSRLGGQYTASRATAIARTEVGGSLNAGHQIGIRRLEQETGLVNGKEWLSVLGDTTRDAHANLDGEQVQGADGLFNLGGVEVPYPAHRSLPVEDRANCQCTILSTLVSDQMIPDQVEEDESL